MGAPLSVSAAGAGRTPEALPNQEVDVEVATIAAEGPMKPNSAWKKASEWALTRFTPFRPSAARKTRPQSLFVLVAMLVCISVADSGVRISLAVFYFAPILLVVAWFGWEAALAVAFACVILRVLGDFVAIDEHALPLWIWWKSLSSLLVFLFVV